MRHTTMIDERLTVRMTYLLDYYDGITLFIARDSGGNRYLGHQIYTDGGVDWYMLVRVAEPGLTEFRRGMSDLRSVLMDAQGGGWWLGAGRNNPREPMALLWQATPVHKTDYLPEPGYILPQPGDEIYWNPLPVRFMAAVGVFFGICAFVMAVALCYMIGAPVAALAGLIDLSGPWLHGWLASGVTSAVLCWVWHTFHGLARRRKEAAISARADKEINDYEV